MIVNVMTERPPSSLKFALVLLPLLFQVVVGSYLRTYDQRATGKPALSTEEPQQETINDGSSANGDRQTRFLARYDGPLGRRMVQRCASVIIQDEDDTDFTVFEGGSRCLDRLKASQAVQLVDEDHPFQALNELRSVPRAAGVFGGNRRSLDGTDEIEDLLPWGIAAVQADQLPLGEHNVTVCIVDTGIAANHPDLDYTRISGMDRYDSPHHWPWREDRAGHGTSSDTLREFDTPSWWLDSHIHPASSSSNSPF
jgi:hypothetical protein